MAQLSFGLTLAAPSRTMRQLICSARFEIHLGTKTKKNNISKQRSPEPKFRSSPAPINSGRHYFGVNEEPHLFSGRTPSLKITYLKEDRDRMSFGRTGNDRSNTQAEKFHRIFLPHLDLICFQRHLGAVSMKRLCKLRKKVFFMKPVNPFLGAGDGFQAERNCLA